MTYAADSVHEEVAYIAFHLHWGMEEILDLEHADRRRYVAEAGRLAQLSTRGR